MSFKQAIVLRSDLGMGKGKLCAQCAHASLEAFRKAFEKDGELAGEWLSGGAEKIVLKVPGEKELRLVYSQALKAKLPCCLVRDAGRTQVPAGTPTAVALGPAEEEKIDAITGRLKLL